MALPPELRDTILKKLNLINYERLSATQLTDLIVEAIDEAGWRILYPEGWAHRCPRCAQIIPQNKAHIPHGYFNCEVIDRYEI